MSKKKNFFYYAHWVCIFDNLFILQYPKPKWTNFFSSTLYGCLLPTLSFLQSMNNENLIKFSKNVKIWKLHVTSSLAFWTMGIFHSLTKFKCFNRFMLKSCRTSIIWFSKLQHFTWLSSELVLVTSLHLGLYFWSNFNWRLIKIFIFHVSDPTLYLKWRWI